MELVTCLEPIYASYFIPVVFILITNSLSSLCIAGIIYMFWWRHRPFISIAATLLLVGILSIGLKFVYGPKVAPIAGVCCTAPTYAIINYTFPSTHAAVVTLLVGQFLKPFFKRPEITTHLLGGGGGGSEIQMGKWEMVIRILCIIFYASFVYASRIVLLTNDYIDVIGGVALAFFVLGVELYVRKLFTKEASFEKVE